MLNVIFKKISWISRKKEVEKVRNYSVKINFLTILRRLLRLLHTTRTRESFSKLSEKRPSPPLMLFSPKFANSSTNYKSEKLIHSAIELYNKNTSKSKELEGYYEPIKLFSQNLSCFKIREELYAPGGGNIILIV